MRDHPFPPRDPDAADLDAARAALAEALAALKARLAPAEPGGPSGGTGLLAVAAAVAAGFGLYRLTRPRAAAPAVPEWLEELRRHETRAADLLARIDEALAEGRLAPAAAELSADDVRAALAEERRRALSRGLDGLAEEERAAILDLRRRKAEGNAPGFLASHPALSAALAAAAAALVERSLRRG